MAEVNSKHEFVCSKLRQEITGSDYKPGDRLPSENRLCDYFGVSRITIRHALETLKSEGLIFKKQGVGTFISDRSLTNNLVNLTDFSEDMKKAGLESSSRLISLKKVEPIKDINEILNLRPDLTLIQVDRVRLANEKPVAFDITWLPPTYGQLLFDEDLTTQTIYKIIEEKYEILIHGGSYRFTAINAGDYISKYLEIEPETAVLEIDRCSRTTGDKKVYYQKRYYNPAHVSYVMELSRNDNEKLTSKHGLPFKEFTPQFAK